MNESVFFAQENEMGITETSAAHLCAIAANMKQEAETFLKKVSFIDTKVTLIGSNNELPTEIGWKEEDLKKVDEMLKQVTLLNGFISWFAEARKALEFEKEKAESLAFDEWLRDTGRGDFKGPETILPQENITFQEVLDTLSVKDRQTYLELEAKAAFLGKYIQPRGEYCLARQNMHEKISHPYKNEGSGRDLVVYQYTPSMNSKEVDSKFFQIQAEYRSTEQQLNHMKADIHGMMNSINNKIHEENQALLDKYKKELDEFYEKRTRLQEEYKEFKRLETIRLSKIKLRVPSAYMSVMETLNKVGC